MQTLLSSSEFVSDIKFPAFGFRQHYMATTAGDAVTLPDHIRQYQVPVQQLCDKLSYTGMIHVTIDEKTLSLGQTQRKPELHVDGRFNGEYWGHSPGWNHYCNSVPLPRMAVAVASTVPLCKVYHGEFQAEVGEQGNLSHIRNQVGEGLLVPANEWHLLSPDCVHESLPAEQETRRSFIRVAFETAPTGYR